MSIFQKAAATVVAVFLVVAGLAFAGGSSASAPAASPTPTSTTAPPVVLTCFTVGVEIPPVTLDPSLLATGDVVTTVQVALGIRSDGVYGPQTASAVSAVGTSTPVSVCPPEFAVNSPLAVALTALSEQSETLTAAALAARAAHVSVATAQRIQSQCGSDFACFKACTLNIESGGNYGAISSGGTYRGAWQFDQRTWDSNAAASGHPELVGADPAAASPAQQDVVAQATYDSRGNQPWGGRC